MLHDSAIQAKLTSIVSHSQSGPHLGNQFTEDLALQSYLPHFLDAKTPVEQRIEMENDLIRFGMKVAGSDYLKMSANAEDSKPYLEQFDAWGARIDTLHTGEGWKYLKREAAVEGLTHIAYHSNNINGRIWQTVKLMLFTPSSGMVSCPLAMTDGAAYTLRELKQEGKYWNKELEEAYARLTSKDPKKHWTSGQWMTEKRGGSDLSRGTDTFAVEKDGAVKLYGYKWFSSATDSDMSLALARFPQTVDEMEKGSGKLGMVFLRIKNKEGTGLNNIQVVRLKDKLGTRQLPTAELILNGTNAQRISDVGQGVKQISHMLTLTRLHNSLSALGYMRRVLALAYDYKERREAFGKILSGYHLHLSVLSKMEKTYRGNLLFLLEGAAMLQAVENGDKTQKQGLRLMTSVLKLFTAKECVKVVSEGLESFGGLGYMENSRIPVIFRDSQVLPIWEGTTNILALDFANDLFKNFPANIKVLEHLLRLGPEEHLNLYKRLDTPVTVQKVDLLTSHIQTYLSQLTNLAKSQSTDLIQWQARDLACNFALLVIPAIYMRRAMRMHALDPVEVQVFHFWVDRLVSEYVEVKSEKGEQEVALKLDKGLLRGAYYGKDHDEYWNARPKL
ncbi:hypothetical protein FGO68_gene7199 [Halteria grandinella]|uniref:Acyl-CoA dehydrogenase n=1 Tax=Halteria grandinella TaxID=5974 RepID=A0A8J8NVS2_HALGN|nr:hypothetical protein FGO68_gene7199 [Halteria grandinella]